MSPELFQSDQSKNAHSQPLRARTDSWTTYPRDSTVAQIFEEIARSHTDSTALVCGEENISYGELNSRANRLANRLRDLNVGPETLVGCCLERSAALIVSLLAILKAGGAYVPIDPAYPRERFELLLADARPAVILTQRSVAATVLAGYSASPLLFVDDIDTSLPASNPELAGSATSLAYVMYTSGSTGVPKGVMVENRSIVRLVKNTNFCRFGADEVFLQFAPVSFDASTFEIWGALLNGARLVIMPPTACSLQELGRVIRSHGVTTLWLTAGLFNLMVEERLEDLRSVRQLLAGGDVLSPWHVQHALENLSDCRLINGYGPTENTTFTCCHQISHGDDVSNGVPIGRPISNSWVYILDQHLRPAPVGTTGELYAAGDGLARGYLNNPRETADKFVLDPFAAEAGSRMYRTGDLGRWRPDGTIEFLGRTDNQIKILGYRVELGEIEAALQTHHAIKQVCVVALTDQDGSKRLAAYYMILPSVEVGHIELREFLQKTLPSYMIPALFIQLDAFPLTPNGKIDRTALSKLAPRAHATATVESNPTEFERPIVELWQDMLGTNRVGLDDNFFDLGGNSLLLTAMHSKLQKVLQREIPILDLFQFTTVRTLARHLSEHQMAKSNHSAIQLQARKQRAAFASQRRRRT